MDKRTEQTQSQIQQAMLILLDEKPYEAITIEDVAQKAKRNRATIYRHYSHKEDILLACLETVMEEIKEALSYPDEKPEQATSRLAYTNLLAFYTYVASNRTLYKALFTTGVGNTIRTRFRRFMAGVIIHVMVQAGTLTLLPAPPNVVANLIADRLLGAIIWWLESDSDFDVALLAEVAVRLGETGLFGLTGQPVTEADISFWPFPANW